MRRHAMTKRRSSALHAETALQAYLEAHKVCSDAQHHALLAAVVNLQCHLMGAGAGRQAGRRVQRNKGKDQRHGATGFNKMTASCCQAA
jgi:hypothetical protein